MGSELGLIIITVSIIIPIGVSLILFSSQIGSWLFDFQINIIRELTIPHWVKTFIKHWTFPLSIEKHSIGKAYSIWFFRFIGFSILGMAAFILYLVLLA